MKGKVSSMTLKRLLKTIKKMYGRKVVKEYTVKIVGTFNYKNLGHCGVAIDDIEKEIIIYA